jgi:nitroreductase
MVFSKPLEEIVRRRYSVRTYSDKSVSEEIKSRIRDYMQDLSGPFQAKTIFRLIESSLEPNGEKLGTYGMVKGASLFIGAGIENTPQALLALGYDFEKLILFLTTLDLGTCWLGGTFNRGEFAKTMNLPDGMLFPAVTPVGYFEKKRLGETLVRSFVKADVRKPWETLFFSDSFDQPLKREAIGVADAFALEMLRLGPSASNKQPWRVVKTGTAYHFYEQKTPGYSNSFAYDIQELDMGIAACHFHLAMLEKGIEGKFNINADPKIPLPEHMIYRYSWEKGS